MKPMTALALAALLALFVILGCSEDEGAMGPSDTTPPTVTGHYPQNGATDVGRSGPYWIAFSEPMDEDFVEATLGFDLDPWQYNLSWNGDTLLITPYSLLDAGVVYTFTVDGDCEDLGGNEIGSDYTFSFTTTTEADNTPPEVKGTVPADDATNVSPSEFIVVTFSEPMDTSSLQTAVELDPEPDHYSIELEGITMTVEHYPFPQNTTVTVTVTTAATDLAGNHLAADYSFDFHTLIDNVKPVLESAVPSNGATGVSTSLNQLVLNFSEPMFAWFDMPPENLDARVSHDIAGDDDEWNTDYTTLTVPVRAGIDLLRGCTYWVKFEDVTDLAGNPLDPNPTTYEFTTAGTPIHFLTETGTVYFEDIGSGGPEERRIENYDPGSGEFDIVVEDFEGIQEIWHMRKTAAEIQHLGRDEYDEGSYQFTMMWDEPMTYLKLPVGNHLGGSWSFSTGATLDPDRNMTLNGGVQIEPYQVDLVSEELYGTFRGCFVHHLDITIIFYEYGVAVDTSYVHDKTWLTEGVGWVKQVIDDEEEPPDTLVIINWDI